MKKALVLAGGGTRGSYQNGAVKAFVECGENDWQIVTGTSIGALNAALIVQKDYEAMNQLWSQLRQDMILKGAVTVDFNLETMINERGMFAPFFKNYIKEQGADISPLMEQIHQLYSPERFFASDTDFGCITVHHGNQTPMYVTKEMMKEHGEDWLISSASAFPVFPVHRFSEGEFVDGGYFDNLPVDFALRLGADEVVAVDLNNEPQHPNYFGFSFVKYLFPKVQIGTFLNFDRAVIDRLDVLGYNDAMKLMGRYQGEGYTFSECPLPSFFPSFLHDLAMMETRIKLAGTLSENIRGASYIQDTLAAKLKKKSLSEKELFFGLMDSLMAACSLPIETVWTYEQARTQILARFADCAYEDYAFMPTILPKDLIAYTRTLDQKGIIAKLVHGGLYPEHHLLHENTRLGMYPLESCLAEFVIYMMKELGGLI